MVTEPILRHDSCRNGGYPRYPLPSASRRQRKIEQRNVESLKFPESKIVIFNPNPIGLQNICFLCQSLAGSTRSILRCTQAAPDLEKQRYAQEKNLHCMGVWGRQRASQSFSLQGQKAGSFPLPLPGEHLDVSVPAVLAALPFQGLPGMVQVSVSSHQVSCSWTFSYTARDSGTEETS